jgi:hypothetical protein
MTNEEHETVLNFDYAENVLKVFTTREGVYNGIKRRLGETALLECSLTEKRQSWSMIIPLKFCRNPALICKILNPDEKTEMPEGVFGNAA